MTKPHVLLLAFAMPEAATNHEAEYFCQSRASLFWPIRAAALAYKKAFTSNLGTYMSSRQIHEDLGVPFFADHIRALTESFDSKLADAGNPLVRQLGRYLTEGWL